ncbi:glycoside hydrolase family 113 [Halobacillus litoralis]|uniref:glycoside hydrolase family 113 n=1 Tax=Halobacillus litoralis TaxID=45668 RepID=UPI001CFD291E|nr:hypothetical protein [Halobacillus litoralis]
MTNESYVPQVKDGKIKSGNLWVLDAFDTDMIMNDVKRMNLNTVNVPIRVDIPSRTSLTMVINEQQKAKAVNVINVLNENNIHVILEPFPFIQGGRYGETEWNPSNKKEWFVKWQTGVINPLIEDIANVYDIWGFNISSNLVQLESMESEWIQMIQNTKNQYNGKVILRTNWWYTAVWSQETQNKFVEKINREYWKYVDFISTDAWFEITNTAVPDVTEIKERLKSTNVYNRNQNVLEEINRFHEVTGKDIFFGGFNIPALQYGLQFPWNEEVSNVKSPEIQANGWQAYRESLEDLDYFLGFSVWVIGNNDPNYSYRVQDGTVDIIHDWFYEEGCSSEEMEELKKEIERLNAENQSLKIMSNQLKIENVSLQDRNDLLENTINEIKNLLNDI